MYLVFNGFCIPNTKQKKVRNGKRQNKNQQRSMPRSLSIATQYRFKRTSSTLLGINGAAGFTNNVGSTVYGLGLGIAFSLGNTYFYGSTGSNFSQAVPNVSEFVALFDRFKIDKVTVRIVPSINFSQSQTTAVGTAIGGGLPIVQEAKDYDDATAPTSSSDLLQRTDVKIVRFDQERSVTVKPRASMVSALGAGGSAAATQSPAEVWYDTTTSGQDTVMYGLKYWSEALLTGAGFQTGYLMVYVEYDLVFSVPR